MNMHTEQGVPQSVQQNMPETKLKRWTRLFISISSGIGLFLLIGYIIIALSMKEKTVEVLVAAKSIKIYQSISENDIKIIEMPVSKVPLTAVKPADIGFLIKGMSVAPMVENELFTNNHIFAISNDSDRGLIQPPLFGMMFPLSWLDGISPRIIENDSIIIMANIPSDGKNSGGGAIIADGVRVVSIKKNKDSQPEAFFLQVSKTQANAIIQARADRLLINILLAGSKI